MAKKDKLQDEMNIIAAEKLENSTEIQKALAVLNKTKVVDVQQSPNELKKFIVEKNNQLSELKKTNTENLSDIEFDEIANQADEAFLQLMTTVINNTSFTKSSADLANAAQSFLNIKLNSRIQKNDLHFKKANLELQKLKLEMASNKPDNETDFTPSDDVVIIDRSLD